MPFYEYECSNCKFYVEALQKISDPPLVKCPSCGKSSLHRLVSAPNFRLKGSGWYETDFKSDKEAKRNIAGAEDKPASDSKEGDDTKAKRPVRASYSNRSQKGSLMAKKSKSGGKKKASKKSKKPKKNTSKATASRKKAAKKKVARKK